MAEHLGQDKTLNSWPVSTGQISAAMFAGDVLHVAHTSYLNTKKKIKGVVQNELKAMLKHAPAATSLCGF